MAVKIVLKQRLNRKVSVAYKTVTASAESGTDFGPSSGRIIFPAGTKAKVVRVPADRRRS